MNVLLTISKDDDKDIAGNILEKLKENDDASYTNEMAPPKQFATFEVASLNDDAPQLVNVLVAMVQLVLLTIVLPVTLLLLLLAPSELLQEYAPTTSDMPPP
jgi:hypothetical protein